MKGEVRIKCLIAFKEDETGSGSIVVAQSPGDAARAKQKRKQSFLTGVRTCVDLNHCGKYSVTFRHRLPSRPLLLRLRNWCAETPSSVNVSW